MKTNESFKIVLLVVLIVGLAGTLVLLFSGKPKVNEPTSGQLDEHGHQTGQRGNAASIEDLVGKPSPVFSLTDNKNNLYSSGNLAGKNVVLFFNEGLMCYPACWEQIASFPKDDRFEKNNAVVLSVVVDSAKDWEQAIKQMPELAVAKVVFDKGAAVSQSFDMLTTASSMHYGSLPGHTYVIIDKEGIVRHVFDDPNMASHNDALIQELEKINENS